ncbi:MAG: protein translocase subunit SecF [Longimicrobiales bacterium]
MRLFQNANFDFISKRKLAYMISGALLLVGVVAGTYFQVTRGSWANYGVDFTGGTLVQVRFEESTSVGELRTLLGATMPGTEVIRFGSEDEYLIRAPQFAEQGTDVADQIVGVLEQRFAAESFEVVRTEGVGPKIGAELQQKALLAVFLSLAFTLIYLAIRFEWRFGVAAVIATLHDMLFALGMISLFQIEVSLTTVAAVLTIIGYSLNDTIIVFDRIRENLKATGRRQDTFEILNRSINETLPRTVLTSGSTLTTLLALYMLGGEIIREFALILILGIGIGTYSSVFIAAPVLLEIERRWGVRKSSPRAARPARAGAAV